MSTGQPAPTYEAPEEGQYRINTENWPDDLQGLNIGNDGYLVVSFRNANGVFEDNFEIDIVRDVTINSSVTTVDSSSRRSGLFKEALPGKIELSISGEILYDQNDYVYNSLQDCFVRGGLFKLGAFTSSGNGPWMYACITGFPRNEELENVVRISAEFGCARFIRWYNDVGPEDHPMRNLKRYTYGSETPIIAVTPPSVVKWDANN